MAAKKEVTLLSKDILSSFLKRNEEDHFNDQETKYVSYSTGSMILDDEVELGTGIHRFCGHSNTGKTSEALECVKNFLNGGPNRKALYVKAEGRLSKEHIERSGIGKVTFDYDKWEDNSCFILKSNTFEFVCDLISQLILKTKDCTFLFVIDSFDALIEKVNLTKKAEESLKVAGPQVLIKVFLRKNALPIHEFGHSCIIMSQVSAAVKIDMYQKAEYRMTSGSGGNALVHFSDYILDFEPRYNNLNILKDPNLKYDSKKNPIIGHWVRVKIKKSNKENAQEEVLYPIKHGKDGKNGGIWVEYEVVEKLIYYEHMKKGGAWYSFSENIIEKASQNEIVVPPKIQGIQGVYKFLEENPNVLGFLKKECLSLMKKEKQLTLDETV